MVLLSNYSYADKPEGVDPVFKVLSVMKYGFPISVCAAVNDILSVSRCETVMHALGRAVWWMAPINALCIAFPCATFISTRIRGKDDYVNHCVGALACVPIFNAWLHPPFIMKMNIAFGVVVTALLVSRFHEYPYESPKKTSREFYQLLKV